MVLLPRLSCLGTSPLLKRAISSSLPAQSRIRPSSASSRFPSTTPSSSSTSAAPSSSTSSLPSSSRYTTTISSSHPFSSASLASASSPAALGQASFTTAIGGGGEFDVSHDLEGGGSRGGAIWDILSGPAAERRKALILKAQDNLLNLVNSHSSNSKATPPPSSTSETDLLHDLFLPSSTSSNLTSSTSTSTSTIDPMILPTTRSLSPSTLLLSPSSPLLSLPPIDLSSAWFSPSHPSHPPSTRKEPSLAEQHLRIEAATDASSRVLGTLSEETRREEEEALGMELFRAVAMGRLDAEVDKGFTGVGDVLGGWIGEEEDGLGDRNVDMISVKRQRKKMMSKHKYKKRRKQQATMRKRAGRR